MTMIELHVLQNELLQYIVLQGARCKYKTGRHNREVGDRSSHATLSSREIGRSRRRPVSDCSLLQWSSVFHLPRPLEAMFLSL